MSKENTAHLTQEDVKEFEELRNMCKSSYEMSLKNLELFGDVIEYDKKCLEISEKLLQNAINNIDTK